EYFLKKMARLTLQPLIENAFQHAFSEGMEDYHFIRLDAWVEDQDLVIMIEDNGVGIETTHLIKLQSQLDENQLAESSVIGSKDHHGIGIMNVHRRIQFV